MILFSIPKNSFVALKVYAALGEEIAELAGREYSAGSHSVTFDPSRPASGMYFYKIHAGSNAVVKKMLLMNNTIPLYHI